MAVTAQKKRDIFSAAMIATLILCAMMARAVTQGQREAAWFLPVSLLRSFIYIGLMTWWGVSIRRRIVQTQARRYLMTIAALCVFWLSIRTVKFFFAVTPTAMRYLWYAVHTAAFGAGGFFSRQAGKLPAAPVDGLSVFANGAAASAGAD